MTYSIKTYPSDGVTTDFDITFDYLDASHVVVSVDKIRTTAIGSDYTFVFNNATNIRVSSVVGDNPVPTGREIKIERETPIQTPAVVFGAGSALSSQNLNKNSLYLTYALQEATDANDAFLKLYLGSFGAAPTSDNDGDTLQVGAVYYDTVDTALYYWTGSTWIVGESTAIAEVFKDAAEAAAAATALDRIATAQDAAEVATNAAAVASAVLTFGTVYTTVALLLASTETTRGTGAIWEAGGFRYIEVASGGEFTTAGGVELKPADGAIMSLLNSEVQDRATNRTEAEAMAKDISDMYGYAQANSCTGGGGGGTVRWVTNGKDAEYDPPVGSLRAAVDAAVTGDVIVFDPIGKIRVELVASIDTTGTDGIIIAAPGGNVEIAHAGDLTAFRLYSDNLILRGVKQVVLPKSVEGGTDRDFIEINPLLCKLFWVDQITGSESNDGVIDIATPVGGGVMTVPCYGTVSRSIFRGTDKTSLVRCSDAAFTDATMLYTTWYLNWFDHCAQRNPTIREQAKADIVNCYYGIQQKTQTGGALSAAYGADARTGGEITVRDSWFTTTVGSGFDAVSVGDANGSAVVSNCYATDGLVFDTAGAVTTPAYTIPKTTAAPGTIGRLAMLDLVSGVAGAGRNSGIDGTYVFVEASTQEPNGDTVRAIRGTVTGRLIKDERDTVSASSDASKLTLGTTNTNVGQLSALIGLDNSTGTTARHVLAVGRSNDIGDAADQSVALGRGHNNTAENQVSVGQFTADNANEIFRVGSGTSDGARKTAISVRTDSGTTVLKQVATERVNTVQISAGGELTITGGYHTMSVNSGTADDLDTITWSGGTIVDGQKVRLMPSSSGVVITVRSGTGNILLPAGTSIALNGAFAEAITLYWAAHRSVWTVESK